MFKKIIYTIFGVTFAFSESVFAQNSLPFTDIPENSPYFQAVKNLYDARVISDDWDHLFRADAPMNRDFFVSLAVQIGCKQCLTPSVDDLMQFQESPFVDMKKTNPFYYCVAYAQEKNITQWYITDNSGKASCENGENFSTNPFCAENSISRIEAAAMLLRRANLWNDTLNSGNFDRSEKITDVTPYWYGYAKKAIEAGILTKKSDDSIGQDEKITRGEFALMASVVLNYTQCNTKNSNNSLASYIQIVDENGKNTTNTAFEEWEKITLVPYIEPGKYSHKWTAKSDNNATISGTDETFDIAKLPPWKWFIDDTITDANTGASVSKPWITIIIFPKKNTENPNNDDDNDGVKNRDDRCPNVAGIPENNGCPNKTGSIGVTISSNPTVTHIGNPITFTPTITGVKPDEITTRWDFGDGTILNTSGTQTHTYNTSGTHTVTLTTTHTTTGETAQSTVIIRITDDKDSDNDGVLDSADKCPFVKWPASNNGCPIIKTPDYGCSIRGIYSGNANCNFWKNSQNNINNDDDDGDGLKNPKDPNNPQKNTSNNDENNKNWWENSLPEDHCQYIPGSIANFGCPENPDNDDDNDGVKNRDDRCPNVAGIPENNGCPNNQNPNADSDGDGIFDTLDACPNVRGLPEWQGCPNPPIYNNISKNICLFDKLNNKGLITGIPVCNACPCTNTVNITSPLRECDIVFPSILSTDKNTMYSRGNFYLIQ